MNEKINLQQLAENLPSDVFGLERDNRVILVSELFGLVAEMLEAGEQCVSLPGFGSFTLSGDNSNPVRFDPDKMFADTVNAPFASFSPVILAPKVTEEMLTSVSEQNSDDPVALYAEAEEPEIAVQDEDEEDIDAALIASEPTSPIFATEHNEEKKGEGNSEIPEPPVTSLPEEEIDSAVIDSEDENALPSDENAVPSVMERDNTFEAEFTPAEENTETVETVMIPDAESDNDEETDYEEPMLSEDQEVSTTRFGIGFFWGLLTGLLVGAIIFLVYVMFTSNLTQTGSTYTFDEYEDEAAAIMTD